VTNRLLHITFRWTKVLIWVGIASLVIGGLAIQYRIHLSNEWEERVKLPTAPSHGVGDRLIVFSPHCDDETLGCGGLIASSVANGANVRVVMLTNGDGYKFAISRAYKTIKITPTRCISFAYKRQQETLRALGILGVNKNNVTFLGYPDRGIDRLWSSYWESANLYTSQYTKANHSPHVNSYSRQAPYCGESLLTDIEKIIKTEKPTDVYVPHPCDNHPDHHAAYCFVAAAIEQLRAEGKPQNVKVHTYIVHRGDWPTPRGKNADMPLVPPYGLTREVTKWYALMMPANIIDRKSRAIDCYKTQVAVSKGFLSSFIRANEIFGDVPVRGVFPAPLGTIKIDGKVEDWTRVPPAVVDAVGDYVVAVMSRSGDVRAVYLAKDANNLYIRVDCVRHLSKRIKYIVNLRGFGASDSDDIYSIAIMLNKPALPSDTQWFARNNTLEIAVPLRKLKLDSDLFIQVQTKLMKITVDNTGWRDVEFGKTVKS